MAGMRARPLTDGLLPCCSSSPSCRLAWAGPPESRSLCVLVLVALQATQVVKLRRCTLTGNQARGVGTVGGGALTVTTAGKVSE